MNHLLNICKLNGAEVEPVDIITFGSPCQDMSVAGKREGMKHSEQGDEETTRSGLFYEAIRIIKEMRESTDGEYPKYAVWENVPGAFSSNKGHDFYAALQAFCSICDDTVSIPEPYDRKRTKLVWNKAGEIVGDNYSIAWRTLDAQYWGVPQRRKRIYLVADFTGRRAGEILFKPESLRGDLQTGNEAGQEVAADAVGSIDGSVGAISVDASHADDVVRCEDTVPAMQARQYKGGNYVCMATQQGGAEIAENLCPTITAAAGMSGNNQPVIALQANGIDRADTAVAAQKTYTMQRSDEYQKCNVASTQSARQYKSATDLVVEKKRKYIIRRLTPTECARLQGFPDWWSNLAPYNPADAEFWEDVRKTHAEINGKKYKPVKDIRKWYDKLHTDSAEYKMWGNGIALPNAEYVIRGIAEQGAKTLGSLFDGSGGFPLAGMLNGIMPVWASEVEPYPIAVTKSRFKEKQE